MQVADDPDVLEALKITKCQRDVALGTVQELDSPFLLRATKGALGDWWLPGAAKALLVGRLHDRDGLQGHLRRSGKRVGVHLRRSRGSFGLGRWRLSRAFSRWRWALAPAGRTGHGSANLPAAGGEEAEAAGEHEAPAFLGGLLLEPQLWMLGEEELARVQDFRVGREGLGHVTFHGQTDCRSLLPQLPEILVIKQGEVIVYPDARKKPPVGQGLNKPARIVLQGCMPRVQTRLSTPAARERYRERVAQMTEDKGAIFEDYDCDDGTWTFRVNHF